MKTKNKMYKFILVIFILLALLHCGMNTASGSSETTNGKLIIGTVQFGDSLISGASVNVRSIDFILDSTFVNKEIPSKIYTDSQGKFQIDSLPAGSYKLEVNYLGSIAHLVTFSVPTNQTEPIDLQTISLQKTAGFYGQINRVNVSANNNIYIQIYGMNRVTAADTNGEFMFSQLPAGDHVIRVLCSDTSYGIIEHDTVELDPASNRDMGIYKLPFEYHLDTLIIRKILILNEKDFIPMDSVAEFKDGKLVGLKLISLELDTLPPEIGDLRVNHMSVAKNNLTELPDELFNIKTMNKFICKENQLTKLPKTIVRQKILKHLDIRHNFIDSLPKDIVNLKKFEPKTGLQVKYNRLQKQPKPIRIWLDTHAEKDWKEYQNNE